jgi:hypothetical protein
VAEKAGSYKCKVTRSNLTPNPFPYGKGNNRVCGNPLPLLLREGEQFFCSLLPKVKQKKKAALWSRLFCCECFS